MNDQLFKKLLVSIFMILVWGGWALAAGQEEEVRSQDQRIASIEKMKNRIAAIESEIREAEIDRANALGDEAFELFGQIDETYMEMKNGYKQQVILLNDRMRRMWEKLENDETESRESLDKKLANLQSEWDRVFAHLTATHDWHLDQLKDSLAKLRGEFSAAAGQAKSELETSQFESLARWEQTHEILLKISQTYAKMVGDQLAYVQQRVKEKPEIEELRERLGQVRDRYILLQTRLQQRYWAHVDHLVDELDIRKLQLAATSGWDQERRARRMVEDLWHRLDTTFKDLRGSYEGTVAAIESAYAKMQEEAQNNSGRAKEALEEKLSSYQAELARMQESLQKSYTRQIDILNDEIDERNKWLSSSSVAEKARFQAKITSLQGLKEDLQRQASAMNSSAAQPAAGR